MNNLKNQHEWDRLNKLVLKRTKHELNQCVDINVPPIFGYPPVPYSPPAGGVDENSGFGVLLKYISTTNEKKSIAQIFEFAR